MLEHVVDVWSKLGVAGGTSWEGDFWVTPLGLFTLCSIILFGLHNIFSKCVQDDIVDRVFYWASTLAAMPALYNAVNDLPVYNFIKALCLLVALRTIARAVLGRLRGTHG